MRSFSRPPRPSLRPFVESLWAFDSSGAPAGEGPRERVLPTGLTHLVIRLSADPLRIFAGPTTETSTTFEHGVVGGARSAAYVRDASAPSRSVGAQLLPGAARLLFGGPASELGERHTSLGDLWGRGATELRDRLGETGSLEDAVAALESELAARMPKVRGIHPAIAGALDELARGARIGDVVDAAGLAHARFIALFRRDVGLAPKQHCRVLRFQRARVALDDPGASIADVAALAGFADQAHLTREFGAIAGITPGEYRAIGPASNHVPIKR